MAISADEALQRLKEGNRRYRETTFRGFPPRAESRNLGDLAEGQEPFAAILACSDSRVCVESIFQQGAGSLFVVRVAGNVSGPDQLASLEFAVSALGVKLILVLGHTHCGAVGSALTHLEGTKGPKLPDNLGTLVTSISGVLRRRIHGDPNGGPLTRGDAERWHTLAVCQDLALQSRLLASETRAGGLEIQGALYELETGAVEFLAAVEPPRDDDRIPRTPAL